ncbi:MAG: helix-turn-helix domain-containing protein [Nitrospinota bacterium]
MASFGQVVKQLRLSSGLTQEQVEVRTGGLVKRGYLSKLEVGDIALPSREKLHALAQALETTVLHILEEAGFINQIDQEVERKIAAFLQAYPEYEVLFQITEHISPQGRRRLLNYAKLIAMEEDLEDLPEEWQL